MMHTGSTVVFKQESDICPFYDLCVACHPEEDMVKRRENCKPEKRKRCAVYWAYLDGYHGLDED